MKINKYLKEDSEYLIQNILESESVLERLYLIRKKLEGIWSIFSLVNKSYSEVTSQQ